MQLRKERTLWSSVGPGSEPNLHLYEDMVHKLILVSTKSMIKISFYLILAYGPIGKYLMHYIVVFSSCT